MEITFAEVRFRRPHRKGSKIVFAAQGSGGRALARIRRHAHLLNTDPRTNIRAFPHQPTQAEREHAELIVPRIPADSAIEIIV